MKIEDATKFMQNGAWDTTPCDACKDLLTRGGGTRPVEGSTTDVHLFCHSCLYAFDVDDFRKTGIMQGSSVPTGALLRRDLQVYGPFFDTEVALTPTFIALWEKYKEHPVLNDKHKKRAILIDLNTNTVYERRFDEDFATMLKGKVAQNAVVAEIFDGMCGYVGLELYTFGRESGMWVQGQVRERGASAWYRSCYADKPFVDLVNAAARKHVDLPHGYSRDEYGLQLPAGLFGKIFLFGKELEQAADLAWAHAEANLRAYLSTLYRLPELQPGRVDGSGFWPMSEEAINAFVSSLKEKS